MRFTQRLFTLALVGSLATFGMACSKSKGGADGAVNEQRVATKTVVAPSREPTALPAERPSPFSASFRFERTAAEAEALLLSEQQFRQESERARRRVRVEFQGTAAVLDTLFAAFREHACDRITTHVERSSDRGGSILQIHAGSTRHAINDRGSLTPQPQWAQAYAACAGAMDRARPQRAEQPAAKLRLSFAEKLPVDTRAELDLGPDHLGIEWDEEQREATVFVATIRPVEITVRAEGATARTLVDLSTHAGVSIAVDAKPDEPVQARLTLIEGAAERVGEVAKGVDRRTKPIEPPAVGAKPAEPTEAKPDTAAQPEPAKTDAPSPK